MNIFESIKSAIANILANKTRTILTAIGIIIGVSSVIVITSIGNGFGDALEEQFSQISSAALQIYPSWWSDTEAKLTEDDLENIKELDYVKYISGYVDDMAAITLKNPNEEKNYGLIGVETSYAEIQKSLFDFKYGRMFNEKENETKEKVAVIDERIANEVFGREDVVGEEINLYINDLDYTFKVAGVVSTSDSMLSQQSIVIPLNTILEIKNTKNFSSILVEVSDLDNLKSYQREIIRIIASNNGVEDSVYYISSNIEQMDSIRKTLNTFNIFISFVAGISLLVGGIGVMNIMIVSVTERTREIGIRKSLGATNTDIKNQFLIESMILCALGGIIGIIIGYVVGNILGDILKDVLNPMLSGIELKGAKFSLPTAIGAMLVSVGVGVIFGVYPAMKAAKLDPIKALSFE